VAWAGWPQAAVTRAVQAPGGKQCAAALGTGVTHLFGFTTATVAVCYPPQHVDWGAFTSESFANGVGYTLIAMNTVGVAGDICAMVWGLRETADEQGHVRPSPSRMKAGAWTAVTGAVLLTAAGTAQTVFDYQLPLSFAKTVGGVTASLGLTVLGGMVAIGGTAIRSWSLYRSFRPAPQAAGGQPAEVRIELVNQAPPQGVGVLQPQGQLYGVAVLQPGVPQEDPPGYSPGTAGGAQQAPVLPAGDEHPQNRGIYELA
jgi:hypothetical protein